MSRTFLGLPKAELSWSSHAGSSIYLTGMGPLQSLMNTGTERQPAQSEHCFTLGTNSSTRTSGNTPRSLRWACMCAQPLSRVWLFATIWIIARQPPLPMGFSRQEFWSRFPSQSLPGYRPSPGVEPKSPAVPVLASRFFITEPLGKPSLGKHP